jgi:RNA polymerase sigma-70 factor (sigma-E family)
VSDPDQRGFEEFVAARRAALLRTAYLLTGSHADAEDLVQAALVSCVPHWSRIAERPEPYVRQVLARESVTRWRRRRWRETATDPLPEPDASAPDVDQREALRSALGTLAPRQRAVVVLRYYEDLTEKETAAVLGIAVGTVKSQARDGLGTVRRLVPGLDTEEPVSPSRLASSHLRTGAAVAGRPPR